MQLSAAPWFSSAKAYPILWERLDNLFSPSWFLGVQVRVSTVSKPKKPKSYTLGAHKLIFFFFFRRPDPNAELYGKETGRREPSIRL